MPLVSSSVFSVLAAASLAAAQTYSDCNPTQVQCPPKPGLPLAQYSHDFTTQGPDDWAWKSIGAGPISTSQSGLGFTISKRYEAPTVASAWYFFFGRAEVHVRAAWGTGIVSAIVLESDDLDEVDWEFIGGAPNEVQTNYFGKGNTTTWDRGGRHGVQDTQYTTHNYTIDWSPQSVTWLIDGYPVRTLRYEEAVGGLNFPQTPMRLKLGIWAGGDPDNAKGTIDWAGGQTDYSKCPFTMFVERVSITNAHPASSYAYGDYSGSWGSIIVSPPGQGGYVFAEKQDGNLEGKPNDKPEEIQEGKDIVAIKTGSTKGPSGNGPNPGITLAKNETVGNNVTVSTPSAQPTRGVRAGMVPNLTADGTTIDVSWGMLAALGLGVWGWL
ncbi:hypothetical protein OQA88_5626 [Cercophora sp. LCS_1]